MNDDEGKKMSRDERLAEKLRENLHRRKAQTRKMKAESQEEGVSNDCEGS